MNASKGVVGAPTKLVCPDCGGVLGEPEPGESGCSCFNSTSSDPRADTHPIANQSAPFAVDQKRCVVCNKNLAGRTRYRDPRGYICKKCRAEERTTAKPGTAPCGECGRYIKETALVQYRGTLICPKCKIDHDQNDKVLVAKVSTKTFDNHAKRNLIILAGVMVVLAVFMLIGYLKS